MALPVKAVSSWNITPRRAALAWKIFTLEDNRFQGSLSWQESELLGSSTSQDDKTTHWFPQLYPVAAPLTCFLPRLWHLSLDFNHHLHVPEFQKHLYSWLGEVVLVIHGHSHLMPKAHKVAWEPSHAAGLMAAWASPRLLFLTIKSSHRPPDNAFPVSSVAPTHHGHSLSQALSRTVATCSPLFQTHPCSHLT